MDVLSNFPNGVAFTMEMDAVPRLHEVINLLSILQRDFTSESDWMKFKDYKTASWEVERVIWSPKKGSSYVNLILRKSSLPSS